MRQFKSQAEVDEYHNQMRIGRGLPPLPDGYHVTQIVEGLVTGCVGKTATQSRLLPSWQPHVGAGWVRSGDSAVGTEKEAIMCDHSYDKNATYLSAFGAGREIYMCQCGALLDNDCDENRAMTPDEVNALVVDTVQKRVADKIKVATAALVKALKKVP